jgi:hypothetical protein
MSRKGVPLPLEVVAKITAAHRARAKPLEVRFWAKVRKTDTCWIWTGAHRRERGTIWINGRLDYAHRVVFHLAGITIPKGMVIDHVCRNGMCVRLDHLRIVTPRVNSLENNISPFAANSRKLACPKGHPYTPENTALYQGPSMKTPGRMCLTCYPSYWRFAQVPREKPPRGACAAAARMRYGL